MEPQIFFKASHYYSLLYIMIVLWLVLLIHLSFLIISQWLKQKLIFHICPDHDM